MVKTMKYNSLKDFLLSIEDLSDNPTLKEIDNAMGNRDKYIELYEKYPNVIAKRKACHKAMKYEPESEYKQGFINLLNLFSLAEIEDPYLSNRINWYLIFMSIYTKDKSYFEMMWSNDYGPKQWKRPDETNAEHIYVKFSEIINPNNDKSIFELPYKKD